MEKLKAPYSVTSGIESDITVNKDFASLEEAANWALDYVRTYCGQKEHIVLHIKDNKRNITVDTVENTESFLTSFNLRV